MTLEEAQARIHELEMENAALRGQHRPYREAYPGAEENGIYPRTSDFGNFLSYMRGQMFGKVYRNVEGRRQGKMCNEYSKKTLELTDEEYEHYKFFCEKLFSLIRDTFDEWSQTGGLT